MTKARLVELSVSLEWGMMGRCGACRCACSCQDRSGIRGRVVAKNCDRLRLICSENILSETRGPAALQTAFAVFIISATNVSQF